MKLETVETPDPDLAAFFTARIDEFNEARWEVKRKIPIAVKVTDDAGEIKGGGAGKTFGFWFLLDHLWVHDSCRGQDLGSRVLRALEEAARARGCRHVLLDTLGFQARGFYEKHGYRVRWTQEHYPREGCKHFMTKDL